jgi:hypothetical protein
VADTSAAASSDPTVARRFRAAHPPGVTDATKYNTAHPGFLATP